jgi:hypothetical protein
MIHKMMHKWYIGIPVVLLAMTVTVAASAEPLRIAKVGDRMGSLVAGLTKVNGGPLGSCAAGDPVVSYVDYVVPGRPPDDTNASFQALTVGDRVWAMIAYDEQDLSTPVAIYADIDGHGLVTHVWSIPHAPQLCAILRGLHYQP